MVLTMAERLDLALLGNPELRLAGQPLARFRSAKVYALLYYLAVTRRAQPRTVLAGLFWGDVDEYYARRNLNRTLSDLTQFVGEHLLVERQSLAFARSQPYWLDVEVLETAATTAPTGQTLAMLASAADLYQGDFLDGFYVQDAPEFEQWVLSERTRLRTSALHLLHTLSQYHAEQGELMPAMDYARRILQVEPWREEAHRQLMMLLAQSGQRSAALAQYELCRQALSSELNVEPDTATLELVSRIRAGGFDQVTRRQGDEETKRQEEEEQGPAEPPISPIAPLPVSLSSPPLPIPHNLPAQRTPFIGRARELADITRLLVEDDDCRLLTVIGAGGMGKTRLALKAAEQIIAAPLLQGRFADGVFFVPLENVSDGNGLVSAMIAAISEESGFTRHSNAAPQDQLASFLRTKSMLLMLDNFEHLIQQADLCSILLTTAPKVKLLVTSREALSLQEAWFYPLFGLALPNNDRPDAKTPPDECDAVRLFIQCARRTRPDFDLEAERAAVVRICLLVEGMPLGIELAAAWLKVMACAQIAQEISRGLDFLTVRYQNIPARHRSMRAVLDHSWTLLTADEAEAIARLAIFRGKFRQEAANAITGASLFTLAILVEKALVRVTPDGHYQLHELTRQYAEEKLTDAAQSALRDAHARYYADLLEAQSARLFTGAYRQLWAMIGGEFDNIRHAWEWLIHTVRQGHTALPIPNLLGQMAEVLANYYLFHSLWLPGAALFGHSGTVLEAAGWAGNDEPLAGQPSQQVALLRSQILTGLFHFEMGHYRASLTVAERALAACRTLGTEEELLWALLLYGRTQMRRGIHESAITALQEAFTLSERLGKRHHYAETMINLGLVASTQGRYTEAQGFYRRALALCQEMDYRPWVARILINLGTTYVRQYDYQQARSHYEQGLMIAQEESDQQLVMICTSNLGSVQRGYREFQLSIDHYQRSLTMARAMGEERWIAANLNGMATTYLEMGDQAAAEQALREALQLGQQSDSTPDTLGSIALLGHLFARRGQLETALKALAFVEQHPATMARDRLYNQPLLAELRSELPPMLFEQAAVWTAEQALDGVARWLLHDELLYRAVV